MTRFHPGKPRWSLLLAATLALGCGEVRGRRLIQKGNQLFRDGQYAAAVAMFRQAERFMPDSWLLWLNEGYTCRQMMIPGAKTPENEAAVQCALDAFTRVRTLRPQDQRGPALFVQTLFDAERYDALSRMYRERVGRNPADEEAINGLVQVYSRWPGHMDEALEWYQKKAELKAHDPEAQYAVGVYVWQQLFAKGGGADKVAYDPRPVPGQKKVAPPPFAPGDIVGQQRVDMSDIGIQHLEKAVQLRPGYQEAIAYLILLYRQKSYAYFDDAIAWQKSIDTAMTWRDRTTASAGKPTTPTTTTTTAPPTE